MNFNLKSGYKVIHVFSDAISYSDSVDPRTFLTNGSIYTVAYTIRSPSRTNVYLKEVKGIGFNSKYFKAYVEGIDKAIQAKDSNSFSAVVIDKKKVKEIEKEEPIYLTDKAAENGRKLRQEIQNYKDLPTGALKIVANKLKAQRNTETASGRDYRISGQETEKSKKGQTSSEEFLKSVELLKALQEKKEETDPYHKIAGLESKSKLCRVKIINLDSEISKVKQNTDQKKKIFDSELYDFYDNNYFTKYLVAAETDMKMYLYAFIGGIIILVLLYNSGYIWILISPYVFIPIIFCLLSAPFEIVKQYRKLYESFSFHFSELEGIPSQQISNRVHLKRLQTEMLNLKERYQKYNQNLQNQEKNKLQELTQKKKEIDNEIDCWQSTIRNIRYEIARKERKFWTDLNGIRFEKEICSLFIRLGYRSKTTKASDDEGIDLNISVGSRQISIQCKHYLTNKVAPKEIREFQGATKFSKKSVFIGSSGFSDRAKDQARKNNMLLLTLTDIINLNKNERHITEKLAKYLA